MKDAIDLILSTMKMMHIILKQSLERTSLIYVMINFVDSEKAFDGVERQIL